MLVGGEVPEDSRQEDWAWLQMLTPCFVQLLGIPLAMAGFCWVKVSHRKESCPAEAS